MTNYRRSVNKPNFGPIIEWNGGDCPVPAGTPISIMTRYAYGSGQQYWTPLNRPESQSWAHSGGGGDILAYYARLPVKLPAFGAARPVVAAKLGAAIPVPQSRDEAMAMVAVGNAWLDDHYGETR